MVAFEHVCRFANTVTTLSNTTTTSTHCSVVIVTSFTAWYEAAQPSRRESCEILLAYPNASDGRVTTVLFVKNDRENPHCLTRAVRVVMLMGGVMHFASSFDLLLFLERKTNRHDLAPSLEKHKRKYESSCRVKRRSTA